MAEVQDLDGEEVGELEAVETQIEQQAQPEPTPQEPELPEKYRGKSAAEIARMHQEAEKLINRHAQEVGEVRKLADELIKSQLAPKQAVEKPREVDFFENPQEAVRQAIESNPELQAAKQFALQARQENAKRSLLEKHPDTQQIVQDPEFLQWVAGSKVRQTLLRAADAYDLDAADELFSTFKQLKQVRVKKEDAVEKQARQESLKTVAVDTGGSGESGKKVYRRADLIRLKIRDPQKYEAMADEILQAYAEGRVR